MKSSAPIRDLSLVLLALAALLLAFLAGRSGAPAAAEKSAPTTDRPAPASRVRQTWHQELATGNAADRTLGVLDLLDACQTPEDFTAAIESIESTADKSEKSRFLAAVFAEWLEKDPVAALAGVRRVESLRQDSSRVAAAFSQWARDSPAAAGELLRQALDGRQNDPAAAPPFLDRVDPPDFILSLVSGLGLSDPSLAATVLAASADSPVRTTGIEVLAQDWFQTDPAAVRTWAAGIDDPSTRSLAIEVAATKGGQGDDPQATIQWAEGLESPADRTTALTALASQWSQRHSAAAFAWARSLPDGEMKFSVMPAVVSQLSLVDPGAAADWLNDYDASPAMDASVAAYAKAIQFTNPSAALGSAAAITDAELREAVIASIKRNQTN